jgi:hypothetical protein
MLPAELRRLILYIERELMADTPHRARLVAASQKYLRPSTDQSKIARRTPPRTKEEE